MSGDRVSDQALAGITVLDFSTRLPGPLATLMLAQAGARVIKIERTEGEEIRASPPQVDGLSAHYAWLNRGKEIAFLDLKEATGRERVMQLLADADVLVEQFRPGVMERLGLGPSALALRFPRLVYCSITGFGQSDPRSLEAAHDLNYQAAAGLLLATAADARGVPTLPSTLLGDVAGGTYPAFSSILLALMQRDRSGKGQHLDISMSRNVEVFSLWSAITGRLTGEWPMPGAGRHTGGSPRYNLYATSDARVLAVAALEDRFWRNFLDAVGLDLPDGLESTDPVAAIDTVSRHLAVHDAAHWLARVAGRDACCNLVRRLDELHAGGHPFEVPLPVAVAFTDPRAPGPVALRDGTSAAAGAAG